MPRPEPRATPRSIGQHYPCRTRPAPPHRQADLDPWRRRHRALNRRSRNGFAHDRNEAGRCRRCRFPRHARQVLAHRASPAKDLCEQICKRRATSDTRAPVEGLRDNPCLLIRRPAPPAARPRENLNASVLPFASSLTSNIRIARCPLPQANRAARAGSLNKGISAPLTSILTLKDKDYAPRCYEG